MRFRFALALRWFALWLVAAGCGSKTGLDTPDAGFDAAVDAGADLDADVPCVTVTQDGGPIELPLQTESRLVRADVAFLIDVTASMQDEIDRIRGGLRDRLAPGIRGNIPDTQFAVASFGDFPVDPFGADVDSPFRLLLPMSDDLFRVQAAVNALDLGNGRDEPESQVEALFQLSTGNGLGSFVPPSFGCPAGGRGYPCFREEALPVVLLFTDASFHNGPGDTDSYPPGSIVPAPHRYVDAVNALRELSIRVIGFDSGDGDATPTLSQLARDTGALGSGGRPLVFDIGRRGERLGTQVIDAIGEFAEEIIFDVDAVAVDPIAGDGVDATAFVEEIEPVSAVPADGVASIDLDANVFRRVESGTRLLFQLRVRADAVVPGPTAQRFPLDILFRGDGRTTLSSRRIEIVVPGADGVGCEL